MTKQSKFNCKRIVARFVYVIFLAIITAPLGYAEFKLTDNDKKSGNFIFEQDKISLVSSIELVFLTGSIHDPKGKEGMADIAFDALLRGTKSKSRDQFASAIETLGASISAHTAYNRTTISLTTISDNLEPAIALLAEAILEPAFHAKDMDLLKKEKLSLLNQARSRVRGVMFRALRQELYRDTPLAHYPDGTIRSVSTITINDIKSFISRYVNSSNLIVAVDSNVDKGKIIAWLEKYLQNLPEGTPTMNPSLNLTRQEGRHLIIVDRKGMTTVDTALAHLSVPSTYPDMPKLEAANFAFGGGGMSNRLFTVLRKENGWTYGAESSFDLFDWPRKYSGVFAIYTFPATEHALKAIPKMVQLYEEYVRDGITEKELEFARNSLVNSYAFNFVSAGDRISGRIYEALDGSPYYSISEFKSIMDNMNTKDLSKIISEASDPNNFILAVAGDPEQLKILAKIIPGIQSIKIVKDPIEKLE